LAEYINSLNKFNNNIKNEKDLMSYFILNIESFINGLKLLDILNILTKLNIIKNTLQYYNINNKYFKILDIYFDLNTNIIKIGIDTFCNKILVKNFLIFEK
jgi:hypothetical protein